MHRSTARTMAIIAGSLAILIGCASSPSYRFTPGTFTGTGTGHGGPIRVRATFDEGRIVSIDVEEFNETVGIGDAARASIPRRIVESQSLDVDAVSGATESSAGLVAAVSEAVRLAGVDPATMRRRPAKAKRSAVLELERDVVVVGAGAAGSAAALSAAESGARVLLLEKTGVPAGAGTLAGGMFANGTAAQKAAGQADASRWIFERYMEASNGRADANLVRAVIAASGRAADWLNSRGARLTPVDPGVGGQPVHIGDPKLFMGYVDGGSAAIAALHDKLRAAGGEILFETPAVELIQAEDGSVTGVVARRASDGSEIRIRARSVVLATGGFGGDEAMMKERFGDKVVPGAIESAEGDGVRMAWKAGAARRGDRAAQFFFVNATPEAARMESVGMVWALSCYPFLWVNEAGKRFCNEEVVFDFARMGSVLYEQPNAVAWMIFDQGTVDLVGAKGTIALADIYGAWKDRPQRYMEFNEPCDTEENYARSMTPLDLAPFLAEGESAGIVVKADRLEDLGAKAGMKVPTYERTVAAYRAMARSGVDDQFFKDGRYLYSLERGPFYAVKITTRCLGSLGGVRIDERIRAVDDSDEPIPGLWVAGADAGGMYGDRYVQVEGGTLGFAYTSGMLAGLDAAGYALENR